MMENRSWLCINSLLCLSSFALFTQAQINLDANYFISPPSRGANGIFSANPIWPLNSQQMIQWTTNISEPYSIWLYQQSTNVEEANPGPQIYTTGNNTQEGEFSFPWTVQFPSTAFSDSPIFFFWLWSDNDKFNVSSHYFNITSASATTSSSLTTSTSSSLSSSTATTLMTTTLSTSVSSTSTSGTTATSTSKPVPVNNTEALKTGLGAGLGVGIPLLALISGLAFWWRRRRRRAQPNTFAQGVELSGDERKNAYGELPGDNDESGPDSPRPTHSLLPEHSPIEVDGTARGPMELP